jgi:4-amino-4-deoxy-L-arabinose transferase-like glycosyltransferase
MAVSDTSSVHNREQIRSIARLLGAIALAGLADHAFRTEGPVLDRVVFLLGAIALFLWAIYKERGLVPPRTELREEGAFSQQQKRLLGVGLLIGAFSYLAFSGNQLRLWGLALLGGGIAFIVVATRQKDLPQVATPRPDVLDSQHRGLLLLGIVLIGAVFRLYQLDNLPADMFNDIAHIHIETEKVLSGDWMIYGEVFPGREPLLFYLNALLARFFGLSFYTLKLSTALIGIATIPVIYLLGREAYNDVTGLLSALFLAVAKWHVLISRVGFRGILTPLTTALALYFLLRGLRRGKRADFLWSGSWLGLGLYGYTAALAVIPAVVLGLGLYALTGHGRDLWQVRRSLLLAVLVALLIALPLLRFMLVDGRDLFWLRPRTRVSETEAELPGEPLQVWLGNLARAAGMFNFRGDIVFRTNIPFQPHLASLTGALFLLGFALIVARWNRGGNALILVFFVMMLMPTTLALAFPQEVPGAVRAGGAMATVMLFPAVAVVTIWHRLARAVPQLRSLWGWSALLAALALWSGLVNAKLCFVEYPQVLPGGNYPLFREMARVIDDFGDDGPVFLKSVPFWDDKDAIRFQTKNHKEWGYGEEILFRINPTTFQDPAIQQGAVIVNPQQDQESLRLLEQIFPQGVTLIYRNDEGQPQFAVFLFNRGGEP